MNTESQLEAQIAELEKQLRAMRLARAKAESIAFIAANKIKKEDVEFSDPETTGMFFGRVLSFAEHLRTKQDAKPWAEWNGVIHHTANLIAGRFLETPGRTADL